MENTKITIEEIEKVAGIIEAEASRIRIEKGKKYGDGFQDFYLKYGLLGMETDLYRKFARIGQFSKTNDPILDKMALENNYLDIINYCVLQLIFLKHNYWGQFSWEPSTEQHSRGAIIDAREMCKSASINGTIDPDALVRAR